MSYAELSSWFPVEEADFVYVHEAFETRLLSGFTAVTRLLVGVIAATTIALAFTGYLSSFISVPTIPTAIELVIALSVINFIGIDISMKRNIAFVVVEVLDLLLVIWSLGSWGAVDPLQMPNGLNGLVHSAFLIFFAYIGFEDLVNVAEETQDASITIPRAILLSIEVTTVLYLLVGRCSRMAGSWTIRFATCTCSTNGTRGTSGCFRCGDCAVRHDEYGSYQSHFDLTALLWCLKRGTQNVSTAVITHSHGATNTVPCCRYSLAL